MFAEDLNYYWYVQSRNTVFFGWKQRLSLCFWEEYIGNLNHAFGKPTNRKEDFEVVQRRDYEWRLLYGLGENSLIVGQDVREAPWVWRAVILLPLNKHNSVLEMRDTKMHMTKYHPQGPDVILGRLTWKQIMARIESVTRTTQRRVGSGKYPLN